jgi:acyl CoA:acetate/3-ketoacid CoA transferase alpha subunit
MSKPKETREFNGKAYVMEESIFGDYCQSAQSRQDGELPVPEGAE